MEVKKIFVGAFLYIFKYKKALAKSLVWPFVAIILLDFLKIVNPGFILSFIISTMGFAAYVIAAVTVHRIILLGPDSVSPWGIVSWSLRETIFILHMIGLFLIAAIISFPAFIPAIAMTVIGPVFLVFLSCWLSGRFSLVFPGIAVDENITFEKSWAMTKNHQITMFLVVIIFPVLFAIPAFILSFYPYLSPFAFLFSLLVIVFEVAALSMAYYVISEELIKEDAGID